VIAVDTNLLVYAHREDSAFFAQASACVTALAEGRDGWAIPWPCLHEFFAIVTHARIYVPPTAAARALDQIAAWLESPTLVLLGEGPGYVAHLADIVAAGKITGARIHDARIAAICRYHGVTELWTADRDFSRMAGLVTRNPLLG
jgi:toxin-antitoxin system PIN domain toxin